MLMSSYRLGELPEPTPLEIWRPGFPEWEQKLAFAPTTVSIVTGHPNHGKTTRMLQLWFQMCREYGFKAAIASFENRAKPHQRRNIRQFMFNRLECTLTDEEKSQADQWNEEHFLWIIHPNRKPTLKWVFDMAEVAVVRYSARIVQIPEAGKALGIGRNQAYEAVRKGLIPSLKIGKRLLVPKAALDRLLAGEGG